MKQDNRICILGMGYVGLTLAVVMAERGFDVDGIEINDDILSSLKLGEAHFFETNLDTALRRGVRRGRLRFSKTIPPERAFDAYVITVGTPLDGNGEPRMDMVSSVTEEIARHMAEHSMVVLRSTVRLGTTLLVAKPLLDATGKKYDLAFCPERTLEGRAMAELPTLPQVVGGVNAESLDRAGALFHRLTPTILKVSSIETAELIKLLDNSFRDMSFGFGNEVALICERLGLSASEVIRSANMGYERTNIAAPGFVGGPCLEKDPHILMHSLSDVSHVPEMIRAARQLNEDLVEHAFQTALSKLDRRTGLKITIMGMAFKGQPDTDDLRGSPSLHMLQLIRAQLPDAEVRLQDYVAKCEPLSALGAQPVDDLIAFEGADIVFIMNNNRKYYTLDFESRAELMRTPGLIYDAWNVVPNALELPEGIQVVKLGG